MLIIIIYYCQLLHHSCHKNTRTPWVKKGIRRAENFTLLFVKVFPFHRHVLSPAGFSVLPAVTSYLTTVTSYTSKKTKQDRQPLHEIQNKEYIPTDINKALMKVKTAPRRKDPRSQLGCNTYVYSSQRQTIKYKCKDRDRQNKNQIKKACHTT